MIFGCQERDFSKCEMNTNIRFKENVLKYAFWDKYILVNVKLIQTFDSEKNVLKYTFWNKQASLSMC